MQVEGMAKINLCTQDIRTTLVVAISSDLRKNMLISCDDLPKLRVVPSDLPNTVQAVKANKQLLDINHRLLLNFNTALSNELNPSPMNGSPMNIKLQENAKPVCVMTT